MAFPEPHEEARRLGYSDASHQRGKRKDLVYDKRRYLQPVSENRLPFSEYDGTFWAVSGSSDSGLISVGPYADENLISWKISHDATSPYSTNQGYQEIQSYRGVQTWEYSTTTTISSDSMSDSGWVYPLCFSVLVGPNHACAVEDYSVTLTITNGAGTQTLGTDTFQDLLGDIPLWVASTDESNDGSVRVVMTVNYSGSGTFKFWFAMAQLEARGAVIPGPVVRTKGGPRIFLIQTVVRTQAKIFPEEHEYAAEQWEGRVFPREGKDRSSYVIPHSAAGREL